LGTYVQCLANLGAALVFDFFGGGGAGSSTALVEAVPQGGEPGGGVNFGEGGGGMERGGDGAGAAFLDTGDEDLCCAAGGDEITG
jgi:hypothetical protein